MSMDGPGEPQGERGESGPPEAAAAAPSPGTHRSTDSPQMAQAARPVAAPVERDEAPGVAVPPPFREADHGEPALPDDQPAPDAQSVERTPATEAPPVPDGDTGGTGEGQPPGEDHAVPRQRARADVGPQRFGATESFDEPEPFGGSASALAAAGAAAAADAGDLELVRLIRGGDALASEELYRRHVDPVRRYARTCCRDADTADDLTNEVFAATLQAIRGGAGPQTAVRAYLLTSVRRVAAAWSRTTRREQLVDDFALFAVEAAGGGRRAAETTEPGADVRAMHVAERSMAVQAFRSLPERWQTVLWHTTVEESSPQEVAPLLGLTPNATSVLAHRAREGLKQAYLQAHVSRALTDGGGCARYADRLGAYARGGLRTRAERGLREHLRECDACSAAALEVRDLNQHIRSVLPIAVIGWFAAESTLKGAGLWGGAVAAGAGGSAAAAGGSGSGGAGSGAASEGLGAPVKVGMAAAVAATVTAATLALLFMGGTGEPGRDVADKPGAAVPAPGTQPPAEEAEPAPEPDPEPSTPAASEDPAAEAETVQPQPDPPVEAEPPARSQPEPEPEPEPSVPAPDVPEPADPEPDPAPEPEPEPEPEPDPEPEPERASYEVRSLSYDLLGNSDEPTLRLLGSSWTWQRAGLSIGGQQHAHGITVSTASSVTIDLNRPCQVYRARVGIDDSTAALGGAVFSVLGDGERLWTSSVLEGGDPPQSLRVPVDGVQSLRLVVEPRGMLGALGLANWAESAIECG